MKISRIAELLHAEVVSGMDLLDNDVHSACGSDMMSDVLAFVKDQAVLLTGLVNPDSVDIILADTGPGIPNVELAMREGYSTAPDNIRSLGFGAGMGLPNMKRYSDEMRIDTEVGKGTTVTMRVAVK